jgi:hypothetical protein
MSKKLQPTSTDVGANLLAELTALGEKVTAWVGDPPALTATDIKRSLKLRRGGEKVISTVAALSNQYGLTIPEHPTDAMVAKMNTAQSLIPLHKKMVDLTKQVSDAIFQAQSESYGSATVHYTTLRRLAGKNGNVQKTLEPVKQFFARKSPAVVQAEGVKRGGRKGSKAAQAAKAQVLAADAHGHVSTVATPTEAPANGASAAATAPAATPTATPSPAPINATHA